MKKRMPRGKKPVLTSPWKIGMLVSLLLVFMSLGASFYIVNFYHVSMKWLAVSANRWGIDASLFLREIFPLAAGVIVVSIMAYFLVTSAVRRYKYYLDSGQDYRTMISLAESIDDLTNPAQIARLSSYPELQSVLRNYGDQIREISRELGEKDGTAGVDALEASIDRLLRGESAEGKGKGAGDYASIYGKIRNHVESNRLRIAELENRCESEAKVLGQAALAYGRAMEAMSGAGEEILAISNAAAELSGVANGLCNGAEASPRPAQQTNGAGRGEGFRAIVADMESSVRKLQDGGHVLQEFSEENNGVAINLALMASRGNVAESDLAGFAERVRATAERFHKLSRTVLSIAQGLLSTCYLLKEKAGAPVSAPGIDLGVSGTIGRIARTIEERSGLLQKQMCGLGSELSEAQELLRKERPGTGTASPEPERTSERAVAAEECGKAFGSVAASGTVSSESEIAALVIDHGKVWGGVDAGAGTGVAAQAAGSGKDSGGIAGKEAEDGEGAGSAEPDDEAPQKSDFSDMSSLRELDAVETPDDDLLSEKTHGSPGESWMEMPGHRWRKIDIEKPEHEDESRDVEVTFEPPCPAATPAAEAMSEPRSRAPRTAPGVDERSTEETDADNDPIYDLLELGAVEFVEEIPARR